MDVRQILSVVSPREDGIRIHRLFDGQTLVVIDDPGINYLEVFTASRAVDQRRIRAAPVEPFDTDGHRTVFDTGPVQNLAQPYACPLATRDEAGRWNERPRLIQIDFPPGNHVTPVDVLSFT